MLDSGREHSTTDRSRQGCDDYRSVITDSRERSTGRGMLLLGIPVDATEPRNVRLILVKNAQQWQKTLYH